MKRIINYSSQFVFIAVLLSSCNGHADKVSFNDNSSSGTSPEWRLGVALYSFNRYPFGLAIEKADSAGVKYVEGFSFHKLGKEFNDSTMATVSKEGRSKMKRMMDKKGIKMQSMYVNGGRKNADEWKFFFDMAKEFGMQYLVSEPRKDHLDMVDSLAGLYNIKVAIHQHSKESGSLYWHPDSVLAALKGHPNMGACADLGHWARSGLYPVKCLKKLKGHILGIHLKDIDDFNNSANDVAVGTGVINFVGVVSELKHQNFTGMVYVECEHKMDNNLPDVVQAIRYFENLTKKNEK